MCRFAYTAMERFQSQVNLLAMALGPDTADLKLRSGLHTGQVTAGVLRGDRSRFSLFGDTVNTSEFLFVVVLVGNELPYGVHRLLRTF